MKRALIAVALFAVPLLIAQQEDSSAPTSEPTQATAQPAAAPKLGHPLDPADVDVLTGKDKARGANSYGQYVYSGSLGYGYRYGSPSIAAAVTTRTSPPLSLGFFHGRPVIVFSDAHSGIFFGPRRVHGFLTPGAFFARH